MTSPAPVAPARQPRTNGVRVRVGEARDRVLASDPGLNRLSSAGRAVFAVGSGLGLEYLVTLATGQSALVPMMLGAVVSMLASFGVSDPTRAGKAITLLCLPLFLLAGMGVALLVSRDRLLSLVVFVAVMFVAVFIRRFGPRSFIGGMIGFMGYFFALFLGLKVAQLPWIVLAVAIAVAWAMVLTLVLFPVRNDRVLRRMVRAFEARLSAVGASAEDLLEATPASRAQRVAAARLHSRLVRVNEAALMIDGQLGAPGAVPDDDDAEALRRALFDGELAAGALVEAIGRLTERCGDHELPGHLAVLVADLVSALRQGRWDRVVTDGDRLTAALPPAPRLDPATGGLRGGSSRSTPATRGSTATDNPHCAAEHPERELRRLAVAALALSVARRGWNDPPFGNPEGAEVTDGLARHDHEAERGRGTGDTADDAEGSEGDEESGFEPAVQLFAGNLPGSAVTVRGMHKADDEVTVRDTSRSTTATGWAWWRRWLVQPISRLSLTTRQAVQVALATGAAAAAGDALSGQRYYWAVLAAFIAFTGTATVAETVTKAVNRTLGTMVGLLAAIPLVALTGSSIQAVLPVILVSIFAGFYLQRVSYALMIFFITLMIGELYGLLGTFTPALMVLRLEETAVGGAIGCAVSLLVLPTRTRAAATAARRGLLTALRTLLGSVDHALRHPAHSNDLHAQARSVDAALYQVLLIVKPLTRTWMIAPNPSARRRTTIYTALAYHARHVARAAKEVTTTGLGATPARRGELAFLTGACAHLDGLAESLDTDRPCLPSDAFTATADILVAVAGTAGALAPLARELASLNHALETMARTSGFLTDHPTGTADPTSTHRSHDDGVAAALITGRVCGPDDDPTAATVTLIDYAGRQTARTSTATDGRYRLTAPAPGTYLLLATAHRDQDDGSDGENHRSRAATPRAERITVERRTALPDVQLPAATPGPPAHTTEAPARPAHEYAPPTSVSPSRRSQDQDSWTTCR